MEKRKLYRSRTDRILWGVCGGLAEYFNLDPVLVRIIFVLLTIMSGFGPGILAYIILAVVIPLEGSKTTTPKETIQENVADMKSSAAGIGENIRSSLVTEKEETKVEHHRGYAIGVILIIIGLLFLMGTFNVFWWLRWDYLWPLILIAIGILIIWGRRKK